MDVSNKTTLGTVKMVMLKGEQGKTGHGALVANTVADMVDITQIYVYTGNETGYTFGDWYYWNGSAWVSGGVYNAVAFETDKTLSVEDMAADAKAAGDEIENLNTEIESINDRLQGSVTGLNWTLNAMITETGEITYLSNAAAISDFTEAHEFIRGGQLVDSNGKNLNMFICQYNGTTFISRTAFNYLDTPFELDSNCTQVRFVFGRPASAGVDITQNDIDTYFDVYYILSIQDIMDKIDEISRVYVGGLSWTLNAMITETGEITYLSNAAAISDFTEAHEFIRGGQLVDSNGKNLNMFICQYNGTTFISRTAFNYLDTPFELDSNCTQVRFVFGRPASAGVDITQNDIDTYFNVYYLANIKDMNADIERLKSYHSSTAYFGKKLSILGDSISTFVNAEDKVTIDGHDYSPANCVTNYPNNVVRYSFNDVTSVNSMWWQKVIDRFNMLLGINESFASSMIAWDGTTESYRYGANKCMASDYRIGHLGENGTPDVIIVFGGTNDINHNTELGITIGTMNVTNDPTDFSHFPMVLNTYTGAVQAMLLKLQHSYPNAKILVLLPYFVTQKYSTTPNDVKKHNDAMVQVCDYLGVDYLDLRKVINLYDINTLLADELHPNAAGMQLIANAVIHKLESIL